MNPGVSSPGQRRWRFGAFELDLDAGELRKQGVRLRIQEQPFHVLGFLIERQGQLVTREELRLHLWGDETFVDFEHSLNAAVTRLRQVLSDSATAPRYIETVPRKGYRFIAAAERIVDAAPELRTAAAATPPDPTPHRSRMLIAAALVLVVVCIGAAVLFRSSSRIPAEVRWYPLTTYPGLEIGPALSPDGEHVAFMWFKEGSRSADIFVKRVDGGPAEQLTNTPEHEVDPAWSPDGRRLAFMRRGSPNSELVVVDISSKVERVVARLGSCSWRSLAWSPDGDYLIHSEPAPGVSCVLSAVAVRTGKRLRMFEPDPALIFQFSPEFSRSGRLAFIGCPTNDLCHIYTVGIGPEMKPRGKPVQMTGSPKPVQTLAWINGDRELVYGIGAGATASLYLQRAEPGTAARQLAALREACVQVTASGDGRLVAVANSCRGPDIWEIPLKNGAGEMRPLIASTASEETAEYSPDGKRIALSSAQSGPKEIWLSSVDGSGTVQLTSLGASLTGSPAWSPDGNWIAFDTRAGGNADIYVVGADGTGLRRLTNEPSSDNIPSWSADGKWIYFNSNRNGDFHVWRVAAGGGPAMLMTNNSAAAAVESADGRYLYFARWRPNSLWRKRLPEGREEKVADDLLAAHDLATGKRGIYFIRNTDPPKLALALVDENRVIDLVDTPRYLERGLAVNPTETKALVSVVGQAEGDLMLLRM